jgi:myo-inositol-1(or 4)-monophosphatase
MSTPHDSHREFLLSLSALARAHWKDAPASHAYDSKAGTGFDPVTALDRQIEATLRSTIGAAFPDDGIWGEEEGWTNEGAVRNWSLDPVDGTRALICGLPSWAVLVGLIEEGRHVAGMIDLPALDEVFVATGGCTSVNGRAATTSGCTALGQARLATTDPFLFVDAEYDAFVRIRESCRVARYGLDALAYARVATGGLDLVVESGLKRHDLDALVAVVRGAGGHIGDWTGGEDWDGGRIVAAASRPLYESAVELLSR